MSAHAPTSRTREAPQGDEEASAELKLGEFQDVDALTHSEAALVINALVAKRSADRKNVNETEYALFLLLLEGRMGRRGIVWGGG
jgi:DNA-directed RNA polymerase II subunit RPB4